MNKSECFAILRAKLAAVDEPDFFEELETRCVLINVRNGAPLIEYQTENRNMFFIVSGSFIRNLITPQGEEKTVMFHTENFLEFFKSYDTIYFHKNTSYEIKANENSVVLAFDFDFLYQSALCKISLLRYYTQKTEEYLLTLDLFRNFQLSLTSEDYLHWLQMNYRFLFQRFPAQSIASFMGITPIWLSRLKSRRNS